MLSHEEYVTFSEIRKMRQDEHHQLIASLPGDLPRLLLNF